MKILTVYYSKSGHTEKLARKIHNILGGDITSITAKKTYASSYGMTVLQAGFDKLRSRRPEIEEIPFPLEEYDIIILGAPTWYFTMAPAMQVFLDGHDFKGKKVYTFSTDGGQPKNTLSDFRKKLEEKGARVAGQFHVTYKMNDRLTGDDEIDKWIKGLKEDAVR
ncbi:flavodoxin [uncultured Dialister sp.]|uniref:flavodoxin family protein n=1 Tax=uncultured Dialister sp. TaxID=278064 RepID=UPI0025F0D3C8|nr:flavodoxin [uncultured Dialister sp.]